MYLAKKVIIDLQETKPEKYGPFEHYEKLRDLSEIYDSSGYSIVISQRLLNIIDYKFVSCRLTSTISHLVHRLWRHWLKNT